MKPIRTFTGRDFHFLQCKPEDVSLIDIAQSLSRTCRYNGHARRHTSTAAHSVRVARRLIAQHNNKAIWWLGLMHDAAEAYIGDVPTPLKLAMRELAGQEKSAFDLVEDAVVTAVEKALFMDSDAVFTAERVRQNSDVRYLDGSQAKATVVWSLADARKLVAEADYDDFVSESFVECRHAHRPLPVNPEFPTGLSADEARAEFLSMAVALAPTNALHAQATEALAYFKAQP